MIFEIPGRPCAKGRPRISGRHVYTPAKTVAYESLVALAYIQAGGQLILGPIDLHITAFFPIPASVPKAKREQMADGYMRHTVRPDADNVAKAVMDGLTGVAWADDRQVWRLAIEKRYGGEPKVVVRIAEG